MPFDRRGADGEQALAVGHQRTHGPGVQHHAAGGLEVVGEPLLARGDRRRLRLEPPVRDQHAETGRGHHGGRSHLPLNVTLHGLSPSR